MQTIGTVRHTDSRYNQTYRQLVQLGIQTVGTVRHTDSRYSETYRQ